MRPSTPALLLVLALPALPQNRTSLITGTVFDQSGAVVVGASIRAQSLERGQVYTAVTAVNGSYSLPRLELGSYAVSAEKPGFRPNRHERITLVLDRAAVVDHHLAVGAATDTLVVEGSARLVEITASAVSSVVDGPAIRELPVNGRDVLRLATLQAGAPVARAQARGVNTGYGLQISIGGSRPFQNSFRQDGLNYTSFNGSTPGSVNGVSLGVDSIAEFTVHHSAWSAQYGPAAGGLIHAVTRSGSNELHGSVFYFHRNAALDTRNFFDPGPPPAFRRHQPGSSLGGPILRNRTFFFASFEALRERRDATTINTTLSAAARRGQLSAGSVTVDRRVAQVLSFYPEPNGATLGDTGLFVFPNATRARQDFFTGRIDHSLSGAGQVFLRYSFDGGERENETDFRAGRRTASTRQHAAVLEESHALAPNVLNTARAGFLRTQTGDGLTTGLIGGVNDPANAAVPGVSALAVLQVGGLTDFPGGDNALGADRSAMNSYQLSDDVTFTLRSHTFKSGGRFEHTRFNLDSQNRPAGEFRFRDIDRFLRNITDRFRAQLPGSDTIRGMRQSMGALYLQDTWRVSRRLTFDIGVRWEWATVPTERHGKISNLDRLSDPALRVGGPLFENPSLRNVVPRAGLAWDVSGSGGTIVRAGYGIFSDLILTPYIAFSVARMPPFFFRGETRAVPPGAFPAGAYAALAQGGTPEYSVDRIERYPNQPYVQQWNFNVERRLGANASLRAAYVGSRGLNLSNITVDANLVQPVIQSDGRLFFPAGAPTVNPFFGQIRNRTFDASSFYHSLQTKLQGRFGRGLQAMLTHTFSKSIDDSSNFASNSEASNRSALPVSGNPKFNRGLSGHDLRHYTTATATWEIPFTGAPRWRPLLGGWQLSTAAALGSGLPTTAWLSTDRARTGSRVTAGIGQRPNLVPGAGNNPVTGNPLQWVDPAAFSAPDPGYLGNLGRNTIIGPGLVSFDASVVKKLRPRWLPEGSSVDLRLEVFNVLNHTNFDLPASERMEGINAGAAREDFARITSAGPSREIQLGVKLRF